MSRDLKTCKSCLMPNTRPRIVFDDQGICNACNNAALKPTIDWESRKSEFLKLVAEIKNHNARYDCVVPWSGGKDSSAIAYKLKFEFGLNPLLVTFSPLLVNAVGSHNREEMLKLGFDHVYFRPDQRVARLLARRFFIERGNPKVAWDAGVNVIPLQVACAYGIPYVFYAEHGESEYGGRVLSEESTRTRSYSEVLEHQIGDDPRNWATDQIGEKDLGPYIYPDSDQISKLGLKAFYFSYFFPWNVNENYEMIKNVIDFRLAEGGRSEGTFTNFDSLDDKIDNLYYYMQYIKFGFGRASRDASRMIYRGLLSRDEAIKLASKYDDEPVKKYRHETLGYLGLNELEFEKAIDLHRNDEIWGKNDNEWILKIKTS